MVQGVVAALALLSTNEMRAALVLPPGKSITSHSRQFRITSAVAQPKTLPASRTQSFTNLIALTPGNLAITAERIKGVFLRKLKLQDQWAGQIHLHLEPARDPPAQPRVMRSQGLRGWQFQVTVPEHLRARELARLITSMMLEEVACRYTHNTVAVPPWLREGMTEVVLQTGGPTLIVQPNTRLNLIGLNPDPFAETRPMLQTRDPLPYADLSLPASSHLAGGTQPLYRVSAHLFTTKLLERPQGGQHMREYLRQLHKFRNSQFAFLRAFQFPTMLAVEQWWTVSHTQFRSIDRFNRWSAALTLRRLEEALAVPVTRRTNDGKTVNEGLMRPQDILNKLQFGEQQKPLRDTLGRLSQLYSHAPPEMARLVRDYYQALYKYLEVSGLNRNGPLRNQLASKPAAIARNTVRQLNQLDTILADLHIVHKADTAYGKTISPQAPLTSPARKP